MLLMTDTVIAIIIMIVAKGRQKRQMTNCIPADDSTASNTASLWFMSQKTQIVYYFSLGISTELVINLLMHKLQLEYRIDTLITCYRAANCISI